MMEVDLRARLLAASPVATIAGTRVTWASRPQGAGLPAVTGLMVSPGRGYTHSGVQDLRISRVQLDCWAESAMRAIQLADAVTEALEPIATQGTTKFSNGLLEAARDFDPESLEGGVTAYRRSLDFMIWWAPA